MDVDMYSTESAIQFAPTAANKTCVHWPMAMPFHSTAMVCESAGRPTAGLFDFTGNQLAEGP